MWNPFKKNESKDATETNMMTADETSIVEAPIAETVSYQAEEIAIEFEPSENKLTHRLKKTARVLLLTLLVLLPVFVLPSMAPGDIFGISKQALVFSFAFVVFILWLIMVLKQEGIVFKLSGLEIGVLAWVGVWLLAALFSRQLLPSFIGANGFISMASLAVLFYLFLNFFEKEDLNTLINFFLLGACLAIAGGLLVVFGVPVFRWLEVFAYPGALGEQFITLSSIHGLAGLAVVAFVLALTRTFSPIGSDADKKLGMGWKSLQLLTVISAFLLIFIINQPVYYWLLAGAVFVISLAPLLIKRGTGYDFKVKTVSLVGPLLILVIFILLAVVGRFLNLNLAARNNLLPETTINQKFSLEVGKGVIDESPLFGYGPDNFPLAYAKYRPLEVNQTAAWNLKPQAAAAEWLNILSTSGLIGLAGFGVLIAIALWRGLKNSLTGKWVSTNNQIGVFSREKMIWLILPAFIAMIGLSFVFPFADLPIWFSFWLMLGWIAIATRTNELTKKLALSRASLKVILTSLGLVLIVAGELVAGYLLIQKYQNEQVFAKSLQLAQNDAKTIDAQISNLTGISNNITSDLKYAAKLSEATLKRINLELNNRSEPSEIVQARLRNLVSSVISIANKMTTDYPNDPQSWQNAGLVFENLSNLVNGAADASIRAYQEAAKRSPNDPNLYLKIANIYFARAERNNTLAASGQKQTDDGKVLIELIRSDYKNAEDNFRRALELKPDLALAVYNLGIVYERENKISEAIKQLELIVPANLESPGLAFELGLLYYRANQKTKAINEIVRAVNLFKDYANARWYLALMLEENGSFWQKIISSG